MESHAYAALQELLALQYVDLQENKKQDLCNILLVEIKRDQIWFVWQNWKKFWA